MPAGSANLFPKVILEEVANDGSATVTPTADHRALFLGEDGDLHLKDSAAAVTTVGGGSSDLDAIITASSGQDIADALSGAAAPGSGNVFATMADVGGGGGGNVSGQTGDTIEIPGLSGSPDRVPASPGAADDEFDTPDTGPITGWTTVGTLAAYDTDTTFESHLYLRTTVNALEVNGIYKACPSLPFTVTAKLTDTSLDALYQTAGIMVAEASPGKLQTFGVLFDGVTKVARYLFTNPTTYGSVTANIAIGTVGPMPVYLRMIVASSTDITFQYSVGGLVWQTLSASIDPSFTVGSVGFFVFDQGGAATEVRAAFDWIRFT